MIEGVKPKCWLCTAPFKSNAQGYATFLQCKGCGIRSHPACAARKNCCFSVENEEISFPISKPAKRGAPRVATVPAAGKRNLDMSFVFSSSPNLQVPALHINSPTSDHAVCGWAVSTSTTTMTTTASPIAPPTLIYTSSTSSAGNSAPILSTQVSSRPATPSCADDAAKISSSVNAVLDAIPESDPSFLIARAMRVLADSLATSVGIVGAKVDRLDVKTDEISANTEQIARNHLEFQAETRGYFVKTSKIEATISGIEERNRELVRAVADARSETQAVRSGYEPDVIKLVGVPFDDPERVRRIVLALGPLIGYKISASAITSVNFGPPMADPSGPDQLVADAVAGRTRRGRDVFVRLAYPQLRDIIVSDAAGRKGFLLRDLDPAFTDDRLIHVYEMLTQDRYRTFRALSSEAKRLRIHGFWHSNGAFYARAKSDGPHKRVYDADDLRKLGG